MYLIKDKRNGAEYKTPFNIEGDTICGLNVTPLIKANVLTEEDYFSKQRCLDKFPFIEIVGKIDGRKRETRNLPYFTWLIVCN